MKMFIFTNDELDELKDFINNIDNADNIESLDDIFSALMKYTECSNNKSKDNEQNKTNNNEQNKTNNSKTDNVNHPNHYNAPNKKECIVEMEEKFGAEPVYWFCILNAYKYKYRANLKHDTPKLDLQKAKWYIGKAEELAHQITLEKRTKLINDVETLIKELRKEE